MTALSPISPALDGQSLFRGILSQKEVPLPFSAAGQPATRLAACDDGSFVFSTGNNVFKLSCSPTRKRSRPADAASDAQDTTTVGHETSNIGGVMSAVSSAIADDFIIPKPFANMMANRVIPHCAHQAEIQSVSADGTRIGSVDSYGRCVVTTGGSYVPSAKQQLTNAEREEKVDSFVLSPVSLSSGDPGWAGVVLKENDPATAIVARQFYKDVTVFDRDVPVRTLHTIMAPTSAQYCANRNMIAVAEGPAVAFYDFRMNEHRACIDRVAPGSGQLLTLDASADGNLLAAAGMDRILHVYDIRTMRVRDRWPGCLKYECAAAILSKETHGLAYVCSVDNEVACGAWSSCMADYLKASTTTVQSVMISGANTKSPRRAYGFRADVRLTGMTRRNVGGEEIAAISESGAFYLLRRKH